MSYEETFYLCTHNDLCTIANNSFNDDGYNINLKVALRVFGEKCRELENKELESTEIKVLLEYNIKNLMIEIKSIFFDSAGVKLREVLDRAETIEKEVED